MKSDTKKLVAFVVALVVIVGGYFAYRQIAVSTEKIDTTASNTENGETETLPASGREYFGAADLHRDVITEEDIEKAAAGGTASEDIEKTDDMKKKLGFLPVLVQKLPSGLTLLDIAYVGENGGRIEKNISDTPKKDVEGICFRYASAKTKRASMMLFCEESDDDNFKYTDADGAASEKYKDVDFKWIEKNVLHISSEDYEEITDSGKKIKYTYLVDDENPSETSDMIICEWTFDDIDYRLMCKNLGDKDAAIGFVGEFIDEMEKEEK